MAAPLTERFAAAFRGQPALFALIGLLVLISGVLMSAQAYGASETTRKLEQKVHWSESAVYTYSVPITRNATIWPIGAELPMGEPAYYRTVTDHIPIDFGWQTTSGVTGFAHVEMVVSIRAESPSGRAYWEIGHKLAEGFFDDPSAGIHVQGVLLLDPLMAEVSDALAKLPPGEGKLNWTVETTVAYALSQGERADAGKSSYVMPIKVQDPRFVLPGQDELTWKRAHGEMSTRATTTTAGWAGVYGDLRAQALVVSGLALIGATVYLVRVDPARGLDAREAAYRRERDRYRDWVTPTAALDARRLPSSVIDVASLEDLVHLAADARTRVLLDEDHRVFYALLPNLAYRYARHAPVVARLGKTSPSGLSPSRR